MSNSQLTTPAAADPGLAPPPSPPRSRRRTALSILHVLVLLLAAAALHVIYQVGVLGPALGVLLPGAAVIGLGVTIVRVARRRAHVRWLAEPLRSGSRRFGVQFVVRATLWLTTGYAAALAFPRALTGAGDATLSYVLIWSAAVLLVLCGLAPARRVSWLQLGATVAATLALVLQLVQLHLPTADPVPLGAPVRGTWMVTSGGRSGLVNHHYTLPQQRDALDLVVPFERRSGPAPTALADYPAYGRPVYAPAQGTVARVVDGQPDQAIGSRDPEHPLGNHLVLDLGGGRHLLLAHLQRSSLAVGEGDDVRPGQPLAAVGNSGNSSEPHLHLQLQSGVDIVDEAGVPTPDLSTFPISFEAAERTRDDQTGSPARDLRSNDLVRFAG